MICDWPLEAYSVTVWTIIMVKPFDRLLVHWVPAVMSWEFYKKGKTRLLVDRGIKMQVAHRKR